MNLFDECIPIILEHEGGYVNDKHDTGGATNYGISLRFLKGLKDADGDGYFDGDINKDGVVDALDAKAITVDVAKNLYALYFWNVKYNQLENKALALHVFDMAVNAGPKRAHMILQEVVGAVQDGVIGPATIAAANEHDKVQVAEFYAEGRRNFYRSIVAKKPELNKFLKGWLNRVDHCHF